MEQKEPQEITNTPEVPQTENLPALDKKEIRVNITDNTKRVMYLIKEFLLNNDYVNLISGTGGAPISVRAAESLVRLGYVHYELIKTDTVLNQKERRKTKLLIKLRKNADFKALYDENEEIRKKTQEILKS
jgi:hypothetical protein